MAKVGAQRAAELTGKSKSTIQRAMNNHKIAFETDANGRRVIDVAELDRAFGLKENGSEAAEDELQKASLMIETERLKTRMKMLEEQFQSAETQIEDLKKQRDKWQEHASQALRTCEHAQKQFGDLQDKIKERERRAKERRQQRNGQDVKKMNAGNENHVPNYNPGFSFMGFWNRMRGQY